MSKFYTEKHRALQEKFDTRRTADLLENVAVHGEFAAHEAEFIQSRDMFFLSTVDASGRPTVSYKGGAPASSVSPAPRRCCFPIMTAMECITPSATS